MRPKIDRNLWILLCTFIILLQCIPTTNQQIKIQNKPISSSTTGEYYQESGDYRNNLKRENSREYLLVGRSNKNTNIVFNSDIISESENIPLCAKCNYNSINDNINNNNNNNNNNNYDSNIAPPLFLNDETTEFIIDASSNIKKSNKYNKVLQNNNIDNNNNNNNNNNNKFLYQGRRQRHKQDQKKRSYNKLKNRDKKFPDNSQMGVTNKISHYHNNQNNNNLENNLENNGKSGLTTFRAPSQMFPTNFLDSDFILTTTESSGANYFKGLSSFAEYSRIMEDKPSDRNQLKIMKRSVHRKDYKSHLLNEKQSKYGDETLKLNTFDEFNPNFEKIDFDDILLSSPVTEQTQMTTIIKNNLANTDSNENIISSESEMLNNTSDIRKSDISYNKTMSFSTPITTISSTFPSLLSSSSSSATLSLSSLPDDDFSSQHQQQIEITSLNENILPMPLTTENSDLLLFKKININKNNNKKLVKNNNLEKINNFYRNSSNIGDISKSPKRKQIREPSVIIIDDVEEFDSGLSDGKSDDYLQQDEPRVLPLRPIIRGPYDESNDEEMSVVYAEQHSEIKLMCEVDLDIANSVWLKNGQKIAAVDRSSRVTDFRFIKESNGGLTINNVMLEDNGKWQCVAENAHGYVENARPVKLVILDRPKPPYLLIDSRRLDAGNIFVPVKENSELSLACISEGGNPKPTLTWEVLLSPGVDRHAQKVAAEVLKLEEIKNEEKEKEPYKINSGAISDARLPAVYRAHHNARILCVMEHPTLKIRQNASLLLDVQYTPSFAISRTPGFGYPLREGIELSLKCDVDSNPASTPRWQKDDGEPPVAQSGDGFLNFTSLRREHSGWYKCISRHLNFQYSSIGYYLSVRYDSVDVTSEPDDQEVSVAASHNPNKGQLEVQLGGAVTLQCPQGSLGCWSHLDPVTQRLRGLGQGLSAPTGQFSLKDVVYQDAGIYKCVGQSAANKKKLEVLQTIGVSVKGQPTVLARNSTPTAFPGSPLHLSVEFCANPPAHAARWLHGDRVYTPGNQYGAAVLAYGVTDLPTPFCKEARLTYVSMHERVTRLFYFIVSTPSGVAEAVFNVNFKMHRSMSNAIDEEEEELSEPEEIHFPVFGSADSIINSRCKLINLLILKLCVIRISINVFL